MPLEGGDIAHSRMGCRSGGPCPDLQTHPFMSSHLRSSSAASQPVAMVVPRYHSQAAQTGSKAREQRPVAPLNSCTCDYRSPTAGQEGSGFPIWLPSQSTGRSICKSHQWSLSNEGDSQLPPCPQVSGPLPLETQRAVVTGFPINESCV